MLTLAPLLAVAFLTNCGNGKISAPGREIKIEEASQWVADHFEKRTNIAKTATTQVGLDNFSCDGMIYPAIFVDPVPIDDPTYINLKVSNNNFINATYTNVKGVVGSYITVNGYRKDPEIGKGNMDYMLNYLLNPFMDSIEMSYVDSLTTIVSKDIFETRYTLDGENLYVAYHFNELETVTALIKEVSIQDPKMTFVMPFTGTGKVSLVFGFDKQGYPIEMKADIDSDDIAMHLGLTGGQIDTTFFTGKMHGKVNIKNKVALYDDSEYAHITFRELDASGKVKETISYTHRGAQSVNEAHGIGTDYYKYIWQDMANYHETILPGYGACIVIPGHAYRNLNVIVNYQGKSYPINSTESNIIQAKTNPRSSNTLIHFYPETFNLFSGDVYVDIQMK